MPDNPAPGIYRVLVLSGPDGGVEYEMDRPRFVVGRAKDCDGALSDTAVSRRHAAFHVEDGRIEIRDLCSSNGTFLDGRRIETETLRPGAIVTVGSTDLTVVEEVGGPDSLRPGPAPNTTQMVRLGAAGERLGAGDRANRDLVLLFRAARALQTEESLRGLGSRLLDLALEGIGGEMGAVLLDEGSLHFREVARQCPSTDAALMDPPRSLVASVVADGHGALTAPEGDKGQHTLCVPLPAQGRQIGAIFLVSRTASPWDNGDLCLLAALGEIAAPAIANLLVRLRLEKERGRLHRLHQEACGIIGDSSATRDLVKTIFKLADAPSCALIQGESGTGKELVARALHFNGPRAGGPFIAINCAALPPDLAESELFGHEKGAFTGAVTRRRGRFELAHEGTLFLDEVGELAPAMQAKLLRVLETRQVERVGSERSVKVDVRIVAATNRELPHEIRIGRFREDLYYRLNVTSVSILPLRERPEDIGILLDHFLERAARETGRARVPRFDDEARGLLKSYGWPGNVRELRNLVERCVVLADDEVITAAALPGAMRGETLPPTDGGETPPSLKDLEEAHIAHVLQWACGNKKKAAAALGIERATLYAKIKKYEL